MHIHAICVFKFHSFIFVNSTTLCLIQGMEIIIKVNIYNIQHRNLVTFYILNQLCLSETCLSIQYELTPRIKKNSPLVIMNLEYYTKSYKILAWDTLGQSIINKPNIFQQVCWHTINVCQGLFSPVHCYVII